MFEINLLPPELRQKKERIDNLSLLVAIGGGILLLMVITGIILGWSIHRNHRMVIDLSKKWDALQPTSMEVAKLKIARETLQKKVNAMESLMANRLYWSQKLNQLSDIVPEGIWLTHLSIGSRAEMVTMSSPPPKDAKEKGAPAPKVERREYKVLILRGNTMSLK